LRRYTQTSRPVASSGMKIEHPMITAVHVLAV
jgi:hypothetical protein